VLVTGKDGACQTESEAGLQQRWQLADFAHQPVLLISKNKTVNLNMQARQEQAV
jgi:hypothetical protein